MMFKMWMMHSFAAQHCFKPFWAYSSRVGIFCPQTTCGLPTQISKEWQIHQQTSWRVCHFIWYIFHAGVLESFRFNHNISAARKHSARMWGRYWNQKSFKVNALERHNMASLPMWRKPLFSSRSLTFASKRSSRIKDCIDFWDYSPFSGHENVVFHGGVFHNIQFFVTCVPQNLRTQTSPQNNILSASKDARINAFGMDGTKIESTDHCGSGNVYTMDLRWMPTKDRKGNTPWFSKNWRRMFCCSYLLWSKWRLLCDGTMVWYPLFDKVWAGLKL